ncbi:MAG: helix-turn-helix domain-containing protein [Candidatus Acetothermia bacterium]|nr:helix-turn-helix domain-containing protein [Candidatus Bipolaricaulota bacterium]
MGKIEAYLSPRELARYLGLSVEDVNNLIEIGELDSLDLNGSTKVRKTEVDRWLDEEVELSALEDLVNKLSLDVNPSDVVEDAGLGEAGEHNES